MPGLSFQTSGIVGAASCSTSTYDEQLYFKKQTVIAALQRLGRLETIPVQDVLPMDNPRTLSPHGTLTCAARPTGNGAGQLPVKKSFRLPFNHLLPLPDEFPAILARACKNQRLETRDQKSEKRYFQMPSG